MGYLRVDDEYGMILFIQQEFQGGLDNLILDGFPIGWGPPERRSEMQLHRQLVSVRVRETALAVDVRSRPQHPECMPIAASSGIQA